MSDNHQKLSVWAFAFALGITWALGVLLLGWLAAIFSWGFPVVAFIGSVYIGYSASFLGGILGAIWAFFDGFVFGLLMAVLYNFFRK